MAIQKCIIGVMSSAIEHVINARLLEDDMTGVREDSDGSGGRRGGEERGERREIEVGGFGKGGTNRCVPGYTL